MGQDRAVVVFDLDGTLCGSDAFGRLLLRALGRSPGRLALAALSSPVWLRLGLWRSGREHAERIVVWTLVVGRRTGGFEALVRTFAAEHAGPAGGRRIDLALIRAREHLAAGDRVVVVTACAQPLARAVCDELDLPGVRVLGSLLHTRCWGLPRSVPLRGERKVAALREHGIDLPVQHAYSDSVRDLPLLRAARTPHLVRPTARALPALLAALGAGVEVL